MAVTRSTITRQLPRGTGETGLAPPRDPIPGAITFEQVPIYAGGRGVSDWSMVGPLGWPQANYVVASCIRLIAHQIQTLPVRVTRGGYVVSDPPGWLANPAPGFYGSMAEAIEQICTSLLWRGNAYLFATAIGANGYPLGWVIANPDEVTIDESGPERVYTWGTNRFLDDAVCHVKWLSAPGNPYGVSPLWGAFANYVSLNALTAYAADLATTGAMPFGVLHTEQRLTGPQATNLQSQYVTTGATRRGVLVLDSGLKWEQLQLSPKDMALIDLQGADARALCAVYGVPPFLVNVPTQDSLTYSTERDAERWLLDLTLDPILTKIEHAISYLFLPGDRMLHFNRDRLTLPDLSVRATAYAQLIASGVLQPVEVRVLEGWPPDQPITDMREVA